MKFFTSCLYFDDDPIARKRHFKDSVEMNREIVSRWNRVVTNKDTVYIIGGIGDFGNLVDLSGTKILLLNRDDLKFYNTYISGVTSDRDEDYDKEMFEVYVCNTYKVDHISFHHRILCKLYSGRLVYLDSDYRGKGSTQRFSIVGDKRDLQRVYENGLGINTNISLNYMSPLSETEIESMIRESKGNLR